MNKQGRQIYKKKVFRSPNLLLQVQVLDYFWMDFSRSSFFHKGVLIIFMLYGMFKVNRENNKKEKTMGSGGKKGF